MRGCREDNRGMQGVVGVEMSHWLWRCKRWPKLDHGGSLAPRQFLADISDPEPPAAGLAGFAGIA